MCGPVASQTNGVTPTSNNNEIMKNKSNNKNEQPSALRRMTPFILYGYTFNTLCYFAVLALLPSDLAPKSKYCPADEPTCARRDLFAFQVVSFLNLSYLGVLGFYTWCISKRASKALPQTPQGRYFGNALNKGVLLPEADYVNAAIVIFQGWDFIASLFFEEHCTAIMMTHHFLAFVCGFFCLYYEVNPYYAVYFGGVCEFSSIFLAVSQTFQYYPPSALISSSSSLSPMLPILETFCQAMFVVTFFLCRIVGWAKNTFMLISDAKYIINNGLLQRYSPGSGWFLWYLLIMSGILGALQVYWLEGIANKILEVLEG